MACGDKYAAYLRTESGLYASVETGGDLNLCSAPHPVCPIWDVESWRNAETKVADLVKTRVILLQSAPESEDAAVSLQNLQTRIDTFAATYDDLQGWKWLTANAEHIELIVANMREGVCLADLLDQAIVAAGGKDPFPETPGGPPQPPDKFGDFFSDMAGMVLLIGVIGAAGAGIYYGRKRMRERRVLEAA